jgi:hypothetical protein
MKKKLFLVVAGCFFLSWVAKAQEWNFKGYLSDFHEVSVYLAMDEGEQLRGWLLYKDLEDSLFLEGFKRGDEWIFMEYNGEGLPTGTYYLEMNYGKLEGYYRDRRERFEWRVELWSHRSALPSPLVSYPILYFSKPGKSGDVTLLLHHRNKEYATGWLFLYNQEMLYEVRGELNPQGEYLLEVSSLKGGTQGYAVLRSFSDHYSLQMDFLDPAFAHPLEERLNLRQAVLATSGYGLLSEIFIPVLPKEGLSNEMQRVSESWFQELQRSARRLDFGDPDNRHSILGSGWFEICKVSEDIFSGFFVLTNNNQAPRYETIPLTFSFGKARPVVLADHFKEGSLDKYIGNYKKHLSIDEDKSDAYYQWLMSQKFEDLVLSDGGILLLSEYHPIYGLKKILITNVEMKKALKRFSKLRRLR